MKLETRRLEIISRKPPQLNLWLVDTEKLERQRGCSYQGEPLTGVFYDIVKGRLK